MPYVTGTHSMVWHMTDDPKLSLKAREAFSMTDNGRDRIFIPCIVFMELLYLAEKGKVPQDLFEDLTAFVSSSENYSVEKMCLSVIERCKAISRDDVNDPWDRLIAATAMHLGFPLITKDSSLQKIGLITVW